MALEITEAISTAVTHLGYAQIKELHERAIRCFLKGNDVFVYLPTGSRNPSAIVCYLKQTCQLCFDSLRERGHEFAGEWVI